MLINLLFHEIIMDRKSWFAIAGTIVALALFAVIFVAIPSGPSGNIISSGSCTKTATLVYATWCGHCQNELNMLGQHPDVKQSIKLVDIDSPAAVPYKQQYGVSAVPFWIWSDGTTATGEKSYSELASLLGCKA